MNDGHVEWISQYSSKVPARVITHMLGLPSGDLDQLRAWSAAWVLPFIRKLEPDEDIWVAEQVVEFYDYLKAAIDDKRVNPGDDIITSLVQAEFAGDRPLTDQEIITIVDHLFIGGNETTTFAMASGLWILLREPGLYDIVAGDRNLIPELVEEVLRIESPTQGLWRAVAEDAVIGGVEIPAGSTVHLRYASANRDERVFACPARSRPRSAQLTPPHGVLARRASLPGCRPDQARTSAHVRSDLRPSPEPAVRRGSQRLRARPDVHDAFAP